MSGQERKSKKANGSLGPAIISACLLLGLGSCHDKTNRFEVQLTEHLEKAIVAFDEASDRSNQVLASPGTGQTTEFFAAEIQKARHALTLAFALVLLLVFGFGLRLLLLKNRLGYGRKLPAFLDATAGILVFNQDHRLLRANEGFGKLRGIDSKSLAGETMATILGLENQQDLVAEINAALAEKKIWRGEICGRTQEGSKIWLYALFYPESDDLGRLTGSSALILDNTEPKKAQLASDRTRHLTSLGEMAGGIAHEINNPLAVINGRTTVLLKKLQSKSLDPIFLQEGLEQIQRTVNRVAKIVSSMRRLSRADVASDDARPEKIDSIIREAIELVEDKIKNLGIQLTIHDVLATSEASVLLRGFGLSQILINLLSNAADAIEIQDAEERWIRVEICRLAELWVQVKVVDSGQGIPKALRQKIMEPFFTTKPAGKGTGLGLSLSLRIAEEHGGRIYYDENSANTAFVLEIPEVKVGREVA